MPTFVRYMLVAGLAGAFTCVPSMIAQEKDRDQGSEQEAIRFEKAKEAAAARQQLIEDRGGRADRAANEVHREKPPASRREDAETRRHADKANSTKARKNAPR